MKPGRLFTILLLVVLGGCVMPNVNPIGTMLPGKMFSLNDGAQFEFEIQTSYGTGIMTAFNPANGEKFSGQYTGIYKGGGTEQGVYTNSWGFTTGSVTTKSAPTGAVAKGVLVGDKGTVINVNMDIQPGARPTGFGEGVDNKGARYQIQFQANYKTGNLYKIAGNLFIPKSSVKRYRKLIQRNDGIPRG